MGLIGFDSTVRGYLATHLAQRCKTGHHQKRRLISTVSKIRRKAEDSGLSHLAWQQKRD